MKLPNSIHRTVISLLALTAACFISTTTLAANAPKPQPVKVFILAGQSNMEGQGVVAIDYNDGKGNLVDVMRRSPLRDRYTHLRDADGNWTERADVWIRFQTQNRGLSVGLLSVGYSSYNDGQHFGPELQFGHRLGDFYTDRQVLLIKTCWGGKSLYKDFRPPSAGGAIGPYYKQMLAEVREALDNLGKDFPDYKGQGYELAGFVWFQGWNDMCTREAVPEYEQNLVHLIKDVRREWNTPTLPVIIGELGNLGREAQGNMLAIRQAQEAATGAAGFEGNVRFTKTAEFARPKEESPCPGHGHHWFANAESYFLIGDALGRDMVELLKGK